jgi:hypothetical protein
MELEVKHLAPYLPYGLKLQYVVREKVEKTGVLQSISHRDFETHPTRVSIEGLYNEEHIWMFKPILRPLSDLDKPIVRSENLTVKPTRAFDLVKDEEGVWCDEFYADYGESPTAKVDVTQMNFWLFEYHFDVYGLIPKGLAVDINTLSVQNDG